MSIAEEKREQAMEAKLRSWWQKIKQRRLAIAVTTIIIVVAIVLIIVGYSFDVTGFNGYIQVSTIHTLNGPTAGTVTRTEAYQPEKTLWDWLQLLIIPAVLAAGGFVLNFTISRGEQEATKQRAKTERKIAEDNQREAALQGYIDKMSELLLHEKLRESQPTDEVRTIARVRTLTILYRLGGRRKGSVLQFLHESKLIDQDKSIISLEGAYLREVNLLSFDLTGASLYKADLFGADLTGCILTKANLIEADLREANLSGANLSGASLFQAKLCRATLTKAFLNGVVLTNADLRKTELFGTFLVNAKLSGANFSKADLMKADLGGANLSGANLSNAILRETNLIMVNLSGADLTGADLLGAKVDQKRLDQAKSLKGATMPDGSIHP